MAPGSLMGYKAWPFYAARSAEWPTEPQTLFALAVHDLEKFMAKEELIQFEGLVTEILPMRATACNSTPDTRSSPTPPAR